MNETPIQQGIGTGINKWLREPLLHFLLLGGLIFLGFHLLQEGKSDERNVIVIDNGVIADMLTRYESAWKRPPTPLDMRNMIDAYVHEEVLYREGVAMGLQNDDPVIRRRVRQKIEVMTEEADAFAAQDDAVLQTYLDSHLDRYMEAPVLSYEQVFIDPSRHGPLTDDIVATILSALQSGQDPMTIGDSSLLPVTQQDARLDRVVRDFGEAFARALTTITTDTWHGPIISGYGLHLIRVTQRLDGRKPSLEEARKAVTRDWENDRRKAAAADYFDEVRKNYDVVISADLPDAVASQP